MSEIRGEVAVVTGASSGIGAAIADALAQRGARVVLAARRDDALSEEVARIQANGGDAIAVRADVSEPEDVARLAKIADDTFGRIDIVVNNAGVFWRRGFAATTADEISHALDVNLRGAMLLTREALPGMLARRHGSIISIASLSGRVAMEPVYSATKYGLRGFSLSLRRQLTGTGIEVSLVSPGNIRTDMTKHITGSLPEPTVVGDAVCDLVVRPRREVVIPRQHYAIAWLESLVPALADRVYQWRHWSPVE